MSSPALPQAARLAHRAQASWTASTKEGVGTAYHTSCMVWFTIGDGIVNEVYYPHVDRTNTRDLQFLITDDESFVHEERRLAHTIETPEKDALLWRVTNSDSDGRFRYVGKSNSDRMSTADFTTKLAETAGKK